MPFEQFFDLFGNGFAHPGESLQAFKPLFGINIGNITAQFGERISGFAVGQSFVDDLAFDFKKVGNQLKFLSELLIIIGSK